MTLNDGFDRTVSEWLDEQAGRGTPGYLDDILSRTTRSRQRPAWSSLERWLPMQASRRLAPVPRVVWLLVVLGLVVALGVAVLAAGSQRRLPAPFGIARNGALVYGASDGDIHALDPITNASKAIITGPTMDSGPYFSRDGSRFLFLRGRATEGTDRPTLMVANADGSDVRPLTEPLVQFDWIEWSPDGSRVLVSSFSQKTLQILGVDGTTSPQVLDIGLEPKRVAWRPDGRELVFEGVKAGSHGLYAVRLDGTGPRAILPSTPRDTDWMDLALSPDGTKIAYTKWVDGGQIHITDVDTGQDRTLLFDGTTNNLNPSWSPDGKQLVFLRYFGGYYHAAVAPATGGPVVLIGPAMLEGTDGAVAEFSPDGSKVIAFYHADNSTWMLDATGGLGERLPAGIDNGASWQRTAP